MHTRARVSVPARSSQRVNDAIPMEELRKRFVQVSQRVGLLFARYEQTLMRKDVAGRHQEVLDDLEQERWALIKEVASLQREKLDEREEFDVQSHKRLTAYLNDLAAVAAKVRAHTQALQKSEGA